MAATWYRMTTCPSPIFWSRRGTYRFDSPTAKWGVCYLAESISSSFLEIWGDKIRPSRRLSWSEIQPMMVWHVEVSSSLNAIELAGETLAVIKANTQSFVSSFALSQEWGRQLMLHPADIDGMKYIARRCGRSCLALFGDGTKPKPHQSALRARQLGPLQTWKGLWPLLDRIQVKVSDLPGMPPKPEWS